VRRIFNLSPKANLVSKSPAGKSSNPKSDLASDRPRSKQEESVRDEEKKATPS